MIPCNAPTRWEVELVHADGRTLSLGLTARHTRRALFSAMVKQGPAICAMIGEGDFNVEWKPKTERFAFDGAANGCFIRFGRTEREIKNGS